MPAATRAVARHPNRPFVGSYALQLSMVSIFVEAPSWDAQSELLALLWSRWPSLED